MLCMREGIPLTQFVEEKVRIKARRFNTLLNEEDEVPDDEADARSYRKQSRGG